MEHWTEEMFVKNPEIFIVSFNIERAPDEVDYLLKRIAEQGFNPGRILDMNCGIGRHSVELGRRGIDVVGTDFSPYFVEKAGERAREANVDDKVRFRVADMREIATALTDESPFDGIVCLWTSLGFYDDDTEEDIVRQCCGLVKPGGFFALDIINRDWLLQHYSATTHRNVGEYLVLEENRYDIWKSRNDNIWTYLRKRDDSSYDKVKSISIRLRLWSPHELITLFEKAGFAHKGIYSGLLPNQPAHELTSINTLEYLRSIRLLYIFGRS
jgi:2-polyprenyl-3-methyl-5-hydroxy-6-metoxy-1,4-benzoquinol methylase